MAIKNITEQSISSVIASRRSARSTAVAFCRCSVCEADVMARALSLLPPNYSTFNCDDSSLDAKRGEIELAVEEAELRVALYPHHGREDSTSAESRLVDFNEREGNLMLNALAETSALPCSCETCLDDVLALTLNSCPPKYGVERDGRLDYPHSEKEKVRQQVGVILALATGVVAGRPRHQ